MSEEAANKLVELAQRKAPSLRTHSRVVLEIEYPSTDALNTPIINRALEYALFMSDHGVPSGEWIEVPGSRSDYNQQGPTRYRWFAQHGVRDE